MNNSWWTEIATTLLAQSGWEWFAASLGIAYVILAAREIIWAWPAAFTSTLIYTILFWEGQLPMQSLLHAYYIGVAVYGYWIWVQKQGKDSEKPLLKISRRGLNFHLLFVLSGTVLSVGVGYLLALDDGNRLPYLDAAVTVFAVMNTMLMARKIIDNWIYWLVINSAAMVLYWQTGFYVTILMFATYWVLAVYGYLQWRAKLNAAKTV